MKKALSQPWWKLLSIQASGSLCMPIIAVGQFICQKYGLWPALIAVIAGNLFLLVLGLLFSLVSANRPLTTVDLVTQSFKQRGKPIFSFVMIFTMLGWFAIQLNIMSQSLSELFLIFGFEADVIAINLIFGMLMTSIMCLGIRGIEKLSITVAPLLLLTLGYAIFSSDQAFFAKQEVQNAPSWICAVSMVIGACILAIIDIPTFFRHSKSRKDSILCIIVLYGLVVPLIEATGIFLTSGHQDSSLIQILLMDQGVMWVLWICLFIALCGWTTNNANLYSAIISAGLFKRSPSFVTRTLVLGGLATLAACFNPLQNYEYILNFFGIGIGSMGAVIISSYFLERRCIEFHSRNTFISWISGFGIGCGSLIGYWEVTHIPAFDAFVVSAALLICSSILLYKRPNERINT